MHLVARSESYKIVSGIVTQALGRIREIAVKVGEVQCPMTFMVIDINNYDLLLRLDFLIKIRAIVDVEKGTIQVRQGFRNRNNIEVLPLNMVNMLKVVRKQIQLDNEAIEKMEKEFNKTMISNRMQMLGDDEFEDQSSA
jgi:hypothetical protein